MIPPLQHSRLEAKGKQLLQKRNIPLPQLLLQLDRMGADDDFLLLADPVMKSGDKISKGFSGSRPCFNEQVRTIGQRSLHIADHLGLGRALLITREFLLHPVCQLGMEFLEGLFQPFLPGAGLLLFSPFSGLQGKLPEIPVKWGCCFFQLPDFLKEPA
ncbi:hypothetical protein D3C75_759600 [compost metagenome]